MSFLQLPILKELTELNRLYDIDDKIIDNYGNRVGLTICSLTWITSFLFLLLINGKTSHPVVILSGFISFIPTLGMAFGWDSIQTRIMEKLLRFSSRYRQFEKKMSLLEKKVDCMKMDKNTQIEMISGLEKIIPQGHELRQSINLMKAYFMRGEEQEIENHLYDLHFELTEYYEKFFKEEELQRLAQDFDNQIQPTSLVEKEKAIGETKIKEFI